MSIRTQIAARTSSIIKLLWRTTTHTYIRLGREGTPTAEERRTDVPSPLP
jgi:hypothetical protein